MVRSGTYTSTGAESRPVRILVADDHPIYRRSLARVLGAVGFEVAAAVADGAAALAACRPVPPDLALLDDELPGGGGPAVARRLVAEHPGCVVVLMSLGPDAERAEKEHDPAVARCLPKTIDTMDLAAELRAVLSRQSSRRDARIRPPAGSGDALAELAERVTVRPDAPRRTPADAAVALLELVDDPLGTLVLAPGDLDTLADGHPADATGFRLAVVANALRRQQQFDPDLVSLTLLLDRGEGAVEGRWAAQPDRHHSLEVLLAGRAEPVLVLFGEGGAGKTTLLRHLAATTALLGLRAEACAEGGSLPYFVRVSDYKPADPFTRPADDAVGWLTRSWQRQYPAMPPLAELRDQGGILLLLDDLMQVRRHTEADRLAALDSWTRLAGWVAASPPGNRLVFSSRSIAASEVLSTPALRVPHVLHNPLDTDQVRRYLDRVAGEPLAEAWDRVSAAPQQEILRSPFYLEMFGAQLAEGAVEPLGRSALVTSFVRRSLAREIERGGQPVLGPPLLAPRDAVQVIGGHWASPWELPEAGALVRGLTNVAYAQLQARNRSAEPAPPAEADALASALAEAGLQIDVLAQEPGAVGPVFRHQIFKEYFAARRLARSPEPELVATEWQAERLVPRLRQVLADLEPAAALPVPSVTGWEDVMLMAAEMAEDRAGFLTGLMPVNLIVAGRLAAQADVQPHLPPELVNTLRWELVQRSRDKAADLRHRLAIGLAVGELGDPRYERSRGPDGDYLLPPLVSIAAGTYPIGDDAPIDWVTMGPHGTTRDHCPRHPVRIGAFQMGQWAVTNAEWALFMAAGGYQDERWWDTANARAWRRGDLVLDANLQSARKWRQMFIERPELLETMTQEGRFASSAEPALWRLWLALDEEAFEAAIAAVWQPRRFTEPASWRDGRLNAGSQPVVGVSWYEVRAYCRWLSAQCGLDVRLPTEVEWEAAARGTEARTFAWGEAFDPLRCNLLDTHIQRTSPVGVFREGDTPEGISDMTGNVMEWTSSAIRQVGSDCSYCYPYDQGDGRENPEAPTDMRRVVRGGGWRSFRSVAQSAFRDKRGPEVRQPGLGFRLVVAEEPRGRGRARS